MKSSLVNLQNQIQSVYSNNGKTTIFGAVYQKAINSQNVLGAPLTQFIDVFTTTGLSPLMCAYTSSQNRLYILAGASPTPSVLLYNFDSATGAYSYVGKIILSLANVSASTHTFHAFRVYDTGSQINIIVGSTSSILINGGTFVANSIATSDFTPGGTTIFPASGTNQKAIYFYQDPNAYGALSATTTVGGASAPSSIGTKLYVQNGAAATPSIYAWDLAVAPQAAGLVSSGISAQTTGITGSSPSAFFQMSGMNGYQVITSSISLFEAVVLFAGSGNVPTGFTAWIPGSAQTTGGPGYFMRDLQQLYTLTVTTLTGTITAGATITSNGVAFIAAAAYSIGATSILVTSPSGWNGNAPVNGSATVSAGTQTTVNITNEVAGNVCFNLSATGAGSAVTPTGVASSFSMVRAGGVSTNSFSFKTGLLPALVGTLLQSNSFQYAKPVSVPANATLNAQDCITFATSSTLYIGKLSELSSGVTSWPSLTPVTAVGGTNIVVPIAAFAVYSTIVDKWVYVSNTSSFVVTPHQANAILTWFGGLDTEYLEGLNPQTVQFGAAAIGAIAPGGNWLFAVSTTIGQRGILFVNIASDANFGNAGVVSQVLNVPAGTVLKTISSVEQLFDYTDSMNFWFRSANTSTDASFNTAVLPVGSPIVSGIVSNGWTSIKVASDLSAFILGPYFQFCVTFDILTLDANTPAQLNDLMYAYNPPSEQSEFWALDNDNTTQGTNTPSYAAWRQQLVYTVNPSNLFARVLDTSGTSLFTANLLSNPSSFSYSINAGISWTVVTSVGSIPFGVDLRLRTLVTPTPSVVAQPSLRES